MVDHKTPVLLLICLTTMLMISGCATTHPNGEKYVGDYKDGKYHGYGGKADKKYPAAYFEPYIIYQAPDIAGDTAKVVKKPRQPMTSDSGVAHAYSTTELMSGSNREAKQAKARAIRAAKYRDEAIRQAKANKEKLRSTRGLAERGGVNAQYNLGMIYHKGLLGVPQDDKEAVKWLMKAAIQGDNEAQDELAYISPAAVGEVIRIQTMNKAKAQCTELGFSLETDKHRDCAVRMFSTARADQRMKEQLKAKRAETDRLIRQSKLNQADSDRRNQEQVRLQRAALKAQKRQRDREVSLRMLRQGLEMMQGQPTPTPSAPVTCFTDSDGAGGLVTHCQ